VGVNYDSIAANYDRRYAINDYSGVEEALADFVGPGFAGRVLEVGCGTGHWLRRLAERGIRVAGVDASHNMLDYAQAQTGGAALARGRAEQLPWANEAFERLFCINALHHFEDKAGFLAEARRVLRPGGQLMTIGLDPHTGVDRWYIYEYFEPVVEIDKRREHLADVGHSGNSTAPHRHFQLMDRPDLLDAVGLPCAFRDYEAWRDGAWSRVTAGMPKKRECVRHACWKPVAVFSEPLPFACFGTSTGYSIDGDVFDRAEMSLAMDALSNHYILIMIHDALGRQLRPWWAFWR
jgi:SAM-dependent methyltransferase